MDMRAVLALKPVLYIALFAGAAYAWRGVVAPAWWRFVGAGLLRTALGFAVGIPLGLAMRGALGGEGAAVVAFNVLYFGLRLLLWIATAKLFFRPVSLRDASLVGLVGVGLNALLDALWLKDGLWGGFRVSFC